MSFTSDIKSELCKIKTPTCCKISECYGILLFGRAFSVDSISVATENEEVVDRLTMLLRQCYSVQPTISGGGSKRDFFVVSVPEKSQREAILTSLGYYGFQMGDNIIKHQNIEDECCKSSFIRGAFLACGAVSNPQKDYHAEFPIYKDRLAEEFYELLKEVGLSPKITNRGKNKIIYFKESENIEDLLTTIQAVNHTLELAGIKIYKDISNHTNRVSNCEMANLSKTVNAAVAQMQAIDTLRKKGEFEKLSNELKAAAQLRENNPEDSLNELCVKAGGVVTKSGLNHRLNRLIQIAKNL